MRGSTFAVRRAKKRRLAFLDLLVRGRLDDIGLEQGDMGLFKLLNKMIMWSMYIGAERYRLGCIKANDMVDSASE